MSRDPGASQTEVGRPKKCLNDTARLRVPLQASGPIVCRVGAGGCWAGSSVTSRNN